MKRLLWLDDIRNPHDDVWKFWINRNVGDINQFKIFWVKDYNQFIQWIQSYNLPDAICFDHDLGLAHYACIEGEDPSGYDAAKWLVDYCINHNKDIPKFAVQSANPVGKENIEYLLANFKKFKNKK